MGEGAIRPLTLMAECRLGLGCTDTRRAGVGFVVTGSGAEGPASAPHQFARQRFNRFPKVPVARHSEQLVDDLLQRRRINVTSAGIRNFPDGVVGRRHAREIGLSGRRRGRFARF